MGRRSGRSPFESSSGDAGGRRGSFPSGWTSNSDPVRNVPTSYGDGASSSERYGHNDRDAFGYDDREELEVDDVAGAGYDDDDDAGYDDDEGGYDDDGAGYDDDDGEEGEFEDEHSLQEDPIASSFPLRSALSSLLWPLEKLGLPTSRSTTTIASLGRLFLLVTLGSAAVVTTKALSSAKDEKRPEFVHHHPYVSSSYYTATSSIKTLRSVDELQVKPKEKLEKAGLPTERPVKTRLAILRPFCEFDAEALPTTFMCWNSLAPCKASAADLGEDDDFDIRSNGTDANEGPDLDYDPDEPYHFDRVGCDLLKDAGADVFLFYSQTFSENEVALKSVDAIMDSFFEPGGWSRCFDNIYAIEANIPQELDLYIPSAQEELYNWVNGPNRQYEAGFRIIQSGEWGDYDAFYLMEGDSIPIKTHWLDVVLSEMEKNRPFAILGAKYNGDKWDQFYEAIPISLLNHMNGNAIYNTSHPLLERLVGQLEVEAPCPYNSIPYDYRMSQMFTEGALGIVPELAPKIMLNEEGQNITLSNNTEMFKKWVDLYKHETPFKETPVIHNYAATNLIPRHMGSEFIIHGAKLYSPWDPSRTSITLVVSEWFFDRSSHLLSHLDEKDHPFSQVIVMLPPTVEKRDDYDDLTVVPVTPQHRGSPDFMDLCEAEVTTDWFMMTNSYHQVATHVDLMFTPGTFKPVVAFTPATYPFCFKYPYCKETIALAQRFNSGHDKVVQDMDMLFHTETRNKFCEEWKRRFGEEGEDLYKHQKYRLLRRKKIIGPPGPTGTSYAGYLVREGQDGMYKFTDRSLYGARDAFIKVFAKEEKLDGMTDEERAKRVGLTGMDNVTDCECSVHENQEACEGANGCIWRPRFESCHPPEMYDNGVPVCPREDPPTMSPTVYIDGRMDETEAPTVSPTKPPVQADTWYSNLFKTREHELEATGGTEEAETDDDAVADDDVVEITADPTAKPTTLEFATKERDHDGDNVTKSEHEIRNLATGKEITEKGTLSGADSK